MSKISIKKDFKDGEKLFASELNNNFGVIEAGVNANEANLEAIIEDAETRLQKELENITADRGWDWGGSSTDRVTFYKGDTAQVDSQAIKNGQMLYNTETGETALDDNGKRIVTGSGNVVYIGDEEPTNEATKIWINSDSIKAKGNQVTNSMEGNETNIAPSVNAVKEYISDKVENYTTEEQVIGTWIDGKNLYRKVVRYTTEEQMGEQGASVDMKVPHGIENFNEIIICHAKRDDMLLPYISGWSEVTSAVFIFNVDEKDIRVKFVNETCGIGITFTFILEYTKTTD